MSELLQMRSPKKMPSLRARFNSGNNIQGTLTFVFDRVNRLTFNDKIKLDKADVFSGDSAVVGGTGLSTVSRAMASEALRPSRSFTGSPLNGAIPGRLA
jgi:hypothetical protein